ncbi:rubredoxin [Methanococcus voltae]|jgi:rubredoxin|uniref:Rubredoxin n=2 Tax=Methanococcus voltae TaxID=2188 RepID=A0A8J7RKY8_METVO|nr:rubredoxin [Methanococcus voltae]MBP2172308.1 rubredoxin [Methanococcus voltae]MBP2200736.1 rubredoxin [Methanococcus voltae]MCS3921460.1 rubredoxin [Methanococcus voltae PS]
MAIWDCTICEYFYNEDKEEIPFEELPEKWYCPICGVSKKLFEKRE